MTTADELRQRLGRTGIWMPPPARIGLDPGAFAADDIGELASLAAGLAR
jgi:hypothetical protein